MAFVEQEANKDPSLRKSVDQILADDEIIYSQEMFNKISPLSMMKQIIDSLPKEDKEKIQRDLEANMEFNTKLAVDESRFATDLSKVRQLEETNQIVAVKAENGELGPEIESV